MKPFFESWMDHFKLWNYSFELDPKTKRDQLNQTSGQGITPPDVVPYIRQDGSQWSSGKGSLRVGSEYIDLTSVQNRTNRYKEYERLRLVPEIEQVITVLADEACVSEDTEVATLYDGFKTIKWLVENKKENFFVYCWDFEKNDYTLGIAYEPRYIKTAKTVKILLDNGTSEVVTADHLILLRNGAWCMAGELKKGDELMPFYKITPRQELTQHRHNQFPRIYSHQRGWIHERQFIDEWKSGAALERYQKLNLAVRSLSAGLIRKETAELVKSCWPTVGNCLDKEGFSFKEIQWLAKKQDCRKVLGVLDWKEIPVYDLSVKDHKNFCGRSIIFHNCQRNDKNNVVEVTCKNDAVKKELDYLMLNRGMLNLNRQLWNYTKRLIIHGDWFAELVLHPEDPKRGVVKISDLPPESMYRIETTKGKVMEFQQSNEGPDYEAITRQEITGDLSDNELDRAGALRFTKEQIVHMRLGEDRKTFYPYGQSVIEPARGPAHQLRLMEDSMVVYRLTRAPERRVFYIDVSGMQGTRAEQHMKRMQDLLRKRKTANRSGQGANAVNEQWHSPSPDEDIWIPTRPNSNTKIDTLPGAQNLGEIDDAVYFRNKLYVALNFPSNYFNNEDAGTTRITLSAQNYRVARMIERIQSTIEDGLYEIADRHLRLRGFPEEIYEDLMIKMTVPSEWREMSRAELENDRIQKATALKGSLIMGDWDVLTRIMKFTEKDADDILGRMKIQKLEDARLQILVTNPTLLGVGMPGADETQMGAEAGGPNPMLPPDQGGTPGQPGQPDQPPGGMGGENEQQPEQPQQHGQNDNPLPEPSPEDIKKYDLEIQNYAKEQDVEEVDFSEG